jgi:hypothetical protein
LQRYIAGCIATLTRSAEHANVIMSMTTGKDPFFLIGPIVSKII